MAGDRVQSIESKKGSKALPVSGTRLYPDEPEGARDLYLPFGPHPPPDAKITAMTTLSMQG